MSVTMEPSVYFAPASSAPESMHAATGIWHASHSVGHAKSGAVATQ